MKNRRAAPRQEWHTLRKSCRHIAISVHTSASVINVMMPGIELWMLEPREFARLFQKALQITGQRAL
jgi:hypothetical protein